jgi:glycosyltransferase involved in cell wall biosynthesis
MAAEMYHSFPKDVRIVYNSIDPRVFWNLHPLVTSLIDKYDILSADYLDIYPLSTTRMVDGKQIKVVIEIMAALKKLGKKVCFIACNAHANDRREKQVIAEIVSFANEKGLNANEMIFTSLEDPKYELGVPREVISQLFLLSNLFIFPSISENCSLVLLEAMLSKNLLVLNDNGFLPFREFAKDNALYFDFGSLITNVQYDNRDQFMSDVAKIVNSEMGQNKALKASNDLKKNFNYDAIFTNQIQNLFYE